MRKYLILLAFFYITPYDGDGLTWEERGPFSSYMDCNGARSQWGDDSMCYYVLGKIIPDDNRPLNEQRVGP